MKMNYFLVCIILSLSLLTPDMSAQKILRAFSLKTSPPIDGIFEPEIWSGADSASGFIQMEPKPGEPASEATSAWFGFDEKNVYAVFKCYQHTSLIAKNQSRDALSKNDDEVGLVIDTYNDNRTGYGFIVNPLSTQIDFKINDDGNNIDLNWDAEWKCRCAEFDGGWCVEIMIPFNSLKFKKGLDTWGINFGRIIRSDFETAYWTGPLSNDFRISQGGKVTGINTTGRRMQLTLFPYLSVFKTSGDKIKADGGGDVKWQISPNVSLNGTVNPDFATVEADQVQINLTRYELSYPEKRLFFQEGNEMYNTRFQTFYSRRIQDINFGEKLNGKIGGYQFNAINVRSPVTGEDDSHYYLTAASIKRDILNSSSLGLIVVDKSGGDSYTRSASLDYNLNLGKTWNLTGQFVSSAPGDFLSHSAWFVKFARENNIYHYHIRFNNVGSSFRENVNQTGFITDDDRREIDMHGTYKFWIKNKFFEYINVGSNNNIFWSQEGILRSWDTDNSADVYFTSRISVGYNYNNEYKLYEKGFYNHRHDFTLGYNTEEWSYAQAGFSTGRNFDRDFYLYTGSFRTKPVKNLSLEYSTSYLRFVPDPDSSSTFINVITANYNFTNDLWIKLFAQNSSSNDRIYIYSLFGWRFKPPFGALYLIYSHDNYKSAEEGTLNLDSFFLKLTLPIVVLK
jgi:hypothetical protein